MKGQLATEGVVIDRPQFELERVLVELVAEQRLEIVRHTVHEGHSETRTVPPFPVAKNGLEEVPRFLAAHASKFCRSRRGVATSWW